MARTGRIDGTAAAVADRARRRARQIVDAADDGDAVSRAFDVGIMALIVANVAAFVLATVPAVQAAAGDVLRHFETFSVAVFSAEYVARIWSATARDDCAGPIAGRLRYAARPMPMVDLLAVLPFYLPIFGVDLRALRILRVCRVFRILKLARYSRAARTLGRAIAARSEQLTIAVGVQMLLLLFAGTGLYYVEHPVQPEAFASIPESMWYGVATLTTVGYGDVVPATIAGRFLGATTAVLGVAMFALPTGIFASALNDAAGDDDGRTCPDCGARVNA